MEKLKILLKDKSIEIIEKISNNFDISIEYLCEMIIDNWSNYGGFLWSGEIDETKAYLIDWPSNRKIIKEKKKI